MTTSARPYDATVQLAVLAEARRQKRAGWAWFSRAHHILGALDAIDRATRIEQAAIARLAELGVTAPSDETEE